MQYKHPQLIILSIIADFVDKSHRGANLLVAIAPAGLAAQLAPTEHIIANCALWFFALWLLRPGLRLLLRIVGAGLWVLDRVDVMSEIAYRWLRQTATRALRFLLTRLDDHGTSE